jgi:CDP-diacylglycerol--glycerol-3-phosphate 3-phosphatidyltransferase
MQRDELLTVSNVLSFARIFLVIPLYYYISLDDQIATIIIIVLAVITDMLDGYLARKLGQVTELGKVLDPVADKICTGGGLIALSIYQGFPNWLTIIIISRDVIIIIGSIFLMGKLHLVIPSNKPGKITVFIVTLFALSYILKLTYIIKLLLILVVIMLVYSGVNYLIIFIKNFRDQNER